MLWIRSSKLYNCSNNLTSPLNVLTANSTAAIMSNDSESLPMSIESSKAGMSSFICNPKENSCSFTSFYFYFYLKVEATIFCEKCISCATSDFVSKTYNTRTGMELY